MSKKRWMDRRREQRRKNEQNPNIQSRASFFLCVCVFTLLLQTVKKNRCSVDINRTLMLLTLELNSLWSSPSDWRRWLRRSCQKFPWELVFFRFAAAKTLFDDSHLSLARSLARLLATHFHVVRWRGSWLRQGSCGRWWWRRCWRQRQRQRQRMQRSGSAAK